MIYILPTQYTLYTHSEPRLEVGQPVVCVADALDEVGAPTILVDELVRVVAAPADAGAWEVPPPRSSRASPPRGAAR